ncbi:MAG TPA: hemerythrin domain-containing protein [Caulobacteraceae bacterium]|jgi:hypothetical protein|nr:hemerythrin domain-containing protein [Caulobacteraceae bacterium]
MPDNETRPVAAKPAQTGAAAKPQPAPAQAAKPAAADPIELLKADHRTVEALFAEYESADDARKGEIIHEACTALIIHAMVEEQVFYPACRKAASDEEPLDEAQVEHDSAKMLIVDLMRGAPEGYRDAKFYVLAEQIKHHVAEEEEPKEGIFARAAAAHVNTPELGQRLLELKQSLRAKGEALPLPQPVSFHPTSQDKETSMARQDNGRDERGRFTDDDDRGNGRRSSRGDGRGWYGDSEGHAQAARSRAGERRSFADDDDDRGRERDDEGRFTSRGRDDDDRDYRGRGSNARDDEGRFTSRGRDDDDDRGRSGGRERGGWFGDPEGHSEASRRGWDEREGASRSRSRYADDDDDRGGRGRGGGGRDDEGRFTSRGRDDDDDRGGRSGGRGRGGWFGDPEGHSEASRRGWDEREGASRSRSRYADDDDDRRSSRSRDDDDDRGRGHGGWSGDSRGHAEAARRGWENRR